MRNLCPHTGTAAARILTALLFIFAHTAFAQATRTWISGVGDDANPCSRTAPCKTFAGAISKTAEGGEINAIDPGGYGAVTITKSITLDGAGTMASILSSGTNGIIINVGASDVVTIRNISINGAGTGLSGIRMVGGGSLNLENVQIFGFTQRAVDFVPASTAALLVKNVIVRNNVSGILVKPNAGVDAIAELNEALLEKNMAYGLRAEDRSTVTVRNSTAMGNVNNGFLAMSTASGPVRMTIEKSTAACHRNATGNGSGIHSNGAQALIRINDVTSTDNDYGLNLAGGTVASWGNNKISGNTVNGAPNMMLSSQ